MSKRNLFLVMFAGLAPFAVPATAADLASNNYGSQNYSDAAYNWSGSYVGGHLGTSSSGFPNPFSSKSGLQFGGQLGTNFQSGGIVYGAELDGSYSRGAKHKLDDGAELKRTWIGAAKVRAGVSFDKTLVYGTAGYSMTKVKPGGTVASGGRWKGGYLLGGGIEQAFAGNVSAKVEYNYVNYGDVDYTLRNGAKRSADLSAHTVNMGVNYRF